MKIEFNETIAKLEAKNQNEIINLMKNVFSDEENEKLASQINGIDLDKVMNLYENATNIPKVYETKIEQIPYTDQSTLDEESIKP